MEHERQERRLSNRFMRFFLKAVEEQMGNYCLQMMLCQAGLERYLSALPPEDDRTEIWSSEFAGFQKGLRDYYGTGARGSLIRVGQRMFESLTKEESIINKSKLLTLRAMPLEMRRKAILEYLADLLKRPKGAISIYAIDNDLLFVDIMSDTTYNQVSTSPICWATAGMILEAIETATGEKANVEEIACRATGADACKFKVSI